jgi:hypothetical protein
VKSEKLDNFGFGNIMLAVANEKPPFRVAWLSGGVALLVAFLILAVTAPNLNKAAVDTTIYPPRSYIEPQPVALCCIMAVTFIPALAIFLFGKRWWQVETLGWLVLALLLWTAL